jgi:hypothetical protein
MLRDIDVAVIDPARWTRPPTSTSSWTPSGGCTAAPPSRPGGSGREDGSTSSCDGAQPVVSSERMAWISSIDESSASSTVGSKCFPRSRVIQATVDSSDHAWR